ncbi:MAG: hypothetical protein Q9218_006198, partial [Villophora microphyllina]
MIVWDYAGMFDAAEPQDSCLVGLMGVAASLVKMEIFDQLYSARLTNSIAAEAKGFATEEYIQEVHKGQMRGDTDIVSREAIEEAVQHILHRGARWRSLVSA